MKISKSLLQAILVGATIGTTATSCEYKKAEDSLHLKICPENCLMDHSKEVSDDPEVYDCPACGMG